MKRRPLSSNESGPDKGEASVPGDTPMARFQSLASKVLSVPVDAVRREEDRERKRRAKERKPQK